MPPCVITAVSQALIAGLGGEVFGGVGARRRILAGVVQPRRLQHHQVARPRAPSSIPRADAGSPGSGRSGGRTRRAPWHSAPRARARRGRCPTASAATRMRSGFRPCRMYAEALALLADAVLLRHFAVRRRTAGSNRPPCGPSCRSARTSTWVRSSVGVEQASVPSVRLRHLARAAWCGRAAACASPPAPSRSRSSGRSPHSGRRCRSARVVELRGVEAGIGLGDARSRPSPARRSAAAACARFCSVGAEHDDRVEAEDVHVDRRGAGHRRRRTRRSPAS